MTNGFMDSLSGALNNRNVLKMMAQVGTELDPQGVGGMLGRPTTQMIQRQSQSDYAKELFKALGGGGSVQIGADGSVKMTAGKDQTGQTGQTGKTSDERSLEPSTTEKETERFSGSLEQLKKDFLMPLFQDLGLED
jgi:hypothetical protein